MNHHHLRYLLQNRELNELYISIAIRRFAISMIAVFIPIYLLEMGYAFSTVMWFFFMLYGVHALCVFPAAKIAANMD